MSILNQVNFQIFRQAKESFKVQNLHLNNSIKLICKEVMLSKIKEAHSSKIIFKTHLRQINSQQIILSNHKIFNNPVPFNHRIFNNPVLSNHRIFNNQILSNLLILFKIRLAKITKPNFLAFQTPKTQQIIILDRQTKSNQTNLLIDFLKEIISRIIHFQIIK